MTIVIGDFVVPKPEWIGSPNNVPSGIVRAISPWGKEGAFCVGDEPRAFAASTFVRLDPEPDDLTALLGRVEAAVERSSAVLARVMP